MISSQEINEFILDHLSYDAPSLALLLNKKPELPREYIINQIIGKKIAAIKLPDWKNINLIYPNKQALEQCSSSVTAAYKAMLVDKGDSFIDLTGGLGVDTYYLSKKYKEATYVESNMNLFTVSRHNLKQLLPDEILHFKNLTAEEFIAQNNAHYDLVYLDPDRRVGVNKKGVKIEECSPNLLVIQDELLKRSNLIMVKFSPLLDIKRALSQLKSIKKVCIVSVHNECKEILFILSNNLDSSVEINCVNFMKKDTEHFNFSYEKEANSTSTISDPLHFIYEPNTSILKAGAFKSIGTYYTVNKLAISSHFYTSNEFILEFPGRIFELQFSTYQLKDLPKKANIISRNHPLKPEEIKKKGKIKDGGQLYILATRLSNNKPIYLVCNRIQKK